MDRARARRSFFAVVLLAGSMPGPAGAFTIVCSESALRAAMTAVSLGATPDRTVTIPPSCTITLTGAPGDDSNLSGDLDVNGSMTIQGAGAASTVIDGGGVDRVFDISDPQTMAVTISGVTIRNGRVADGAGIRNSRTVTLSDSVVSDNITPGNSGGIDNSGELVVLRTLVTGNSGFLAGGIRNNGGTLTVTDSVVSGNFSTGIHNSGGTALVIRSSIIDNEEGSSGGGLVNVGGATLTVTNSTISGNLSGSNGGGIFINSGSATFAHATITDNEAAGAGGGVSVFGGAVSMASTILAGNTVGS
ncbi:MAG: right-handed parallel beta-helix repeat-containing protein, partial [Candidatus Rokuibacteriota bacterium]